MAVPAPAPSDRSSLSPALAYCSGFVVLGLAGGALGPSLEHFARQTDASLAEVGALFSAAGLGHLGGNALGSRCYDLFPGHRVLIAALAVLAAALLVVPWVPALWLLVVAYLVMGLAKGALDSGGNTLILWSYQKHAARYLTALHFCFGVGALLAPLLLAQTMLLTGGIVPGYGLLALGAVLVLLWYARLPSPVPARATAVQRSSAHGRFVLLLAVFLFLYTGTEVAFGGWIFTYASVHRSIELEEAGYLASSFWGALTVTRLVATPLMTSRRPFAALLTALLLSLGSAAVLALGTSDASLWAGTLALGAGMAIIYPMAMALAHHTGRASGRTIGLLGAGASLGAMSLPWTIGRLSASIDPAIVLWAPLVMLPLALAVLLALRVGVDRGGFTPGLSGKLG